MGRHNESGRPAGLTHKGRHQTRKRRKALGRLKRARDAIRGLNNDHH